MIQTKLSPDTDSDIEFDAVIESFKADFALIKEQGFVPSNRFHNTGVGKTFEDLMGIAENNNQCVDYKGVLEVKSSRKLSSSMVTLFTKSPTHPKGANTYLRETFGYPDSKYPDLKILHTTINGLNFNTCKGEYGYKLEIDTNEERMYILIKNLSTGVHEFTDAYYDFDVLKHIVETKCKNIAFIDVDTKKEDGIELFHFKSATLLQGLTFDRFIHMVSKGKILYDIRIGAYKTGIKRGKSHDHGSGFRIQKKDIGKVFYREDL